MIIPASVRVCCFRECGCGSACPCDSPRYALLSLMYAARVLRELTPAKLVINHRWRREYVPTMPNNRYSESALRTISTLYSLSSLSANSANVFECCRCISFLLAADHSVCLACYYSNLLEITFVFFLPPLPPLYFFLHAQTGCSAFFIPRYARAPVTFLFLLPRYKIRLRKGQNTKDNIRALMAGKFNLPSRFAMST